MHCIIPLFAEANLKALERRSLIYFPVLLCLQDYQEHQNEIHAKLIAIMGDRLSIHIKSLEVRVVSD